VGWEDKGVIFLKSTVTTILISNIIGDFFCAISLEAPNRLPGLLELAGVARPGRMLELAGVANGEKEVARSRVESFAAQCGTSTYQTSTQLSFLVIYRKNRDRQGC
jgi:hypothetical protein